MQSIKCTFDKDERLKSRKIIHELFESGKILHNYPFKVLYAYRLSHESKFPAQIAVSVSKKNFKRAVDRNYIKRKIREAYRTNKHDLYSILTDRNQILYLFVIYTAKKDLAYSVIEQEIRSLISTLKQKVLNDLTNS